MVENVTVASNTVHVEETSTQMGEVIDSEKITSPPGDAELYRPVGAAARGDPGHLWPFGRFGRTVYLGWFRHQPAFRRP